MVRETGRLANRRRLELGASRPVRLLVCLEPSTGRAPSQTVDQILPMVLTPDELAAFKQEMT